VPDALLSAAPLLLGTDGTKMSKSRGNTIPLAASADETARLIRGAKTDAERYITYDPVARPEVSSLVLLAALCLGRSPVDVAADLGTGGAAALKDTVTMAVNEMLAPVRARRAEYARDLGYVRQVIRDGNERAEAVAAAASVQPPARGPSVARLGPWQVRPLRGWPVEGSPDDGADLMTELTW
jgi:tryptophanyl-tRNA synthetase